ncbi:MAG: hypothetical protein LBB62_07730, partial [Proteiniphilum sp.]|nr:hypothetical protein [Proteiniphilum sp.]
MIHKTESICCKKKKLGVKREASQVLCKSGQIVLRGWSGLLAYKQNNTGLSSTVIIFAREKGIQMGRTVTQIKDFRETRPSSGDSPDD